MTCFHLFHRQNFLQNPASAMPTHTPPAPVDPSQVAAMQQLAVATPTPPVQPRCLAVSRIEQNQKVDESNNMMIQVAMYRAMMDQQKGQVPQGPTMADLSNFMLTQGRSMRYQPRNLATDIRGQLQQQLKDSQVTHVHMHSMFVHLPFSMF